LSFAAELITIATVAAFAGSVATALMLANLANL
jgi:hypothetical protein